MRFQKYRQFYIEIFETEPGKRGRFSADIWVSGPDKSGQFVSRHITNHIDPCSICDASYRKLCAEIRKYTGYSLPRYGMLPLDECPSCPHRKAIIDGRQTPPRVLCPADAGSDDSILFPAHEVNRRKREYWAAKKITTS